MLVSVVIPAYNAEEWVSETIESVLRQTHTDLEIIVVDDGSTDRSAEVAERSLKGRGVSHQILRQTNGGAAGARNLGWRSARGPWVQFLDADDLLEPQKIALQLTEAMRGGAVDVVYSDWRKLALMGNRWTPYDLRTPIICGDALADVLSDRSFLQISSLLFSADILALVGGFDQSHEPIEDVGVCVKIAMAGGVFVKAQSSHPMSSYRDVPRSFSKVNHRRFMESCIKNAKLAEQHVRRDPRCSQRTVDAIVDIYFAGARYFASEDWVRFEEVLADIEALQPGFVPKTPRRLSLLSRIAGYRRAEWIAALYRKRKRSIVDLRRRLPGGRC